MLHSFTPSATLHFENPLERAEHYAVTLRRSKRRAIIQSKRLKVLPHLRAVYSVSPSDFMHQVNSGSDASGCLQGLTLALNTDQAVQDYLKSTDCRTVNRFAETLLSLIDHPQ